VHTDDARNRSKQGVHHALGAADKSPLAREIVIHRRIEDLELMELIGTVEKRCLLAPYGTFLWAVAAFPHLHSGAK
jgi:hypothetical protein